MSESVCVCVLDGSVSGGCSGFRDDLGAYLWEGTRADFLNI